MRVLVALLFALPMLAGCFGPYASDLELPPPPPRPVSHVWDYGLDSVVSQPAPGDPIPSAMLRLSGWQGAEPNIGITSDGTVFVTAFDDTLRTTDFRVWEPVYSFEPDLGSGGGETETGDPMLWVDPITDIVYSNHMYPSLVCFSTAWSEDLGDTWRENDRSCTLPGVDHQKFFTAPPGPAAPAIAGDEHPTVLYQCYQRVVDPELLGAPNPGVPTMSGFSTFCNMSYDGGNTWPAETMSAARLPTSCGGINGHPAAAPDGTIVVPITRGCDGLYVSVSLDSGLSWIVRPGPKEVGAESIDADLTFTPDGTLYAIWRGSDHITYLARSPDLGATWDGPFRVTPPHVKSTVFQAISSGADGHVAMAFLGTDEHATDPSQAPDDTQWDLYIVTTSNANEDNPTFRAIRANAETDPIQIGCVWLHGGGNPCRNMLDFIDSAAHPDGRFVVAFTKGCGASCGGKAGATADDSRDRDSAVAVLSGWSLNG